MSEVGVHEAKTNVSPVAVEHVHALETARLPALHTDPFDRLLVAQARILGVPLVSADQQLAAYPVELIHV